MVEPVPGAKGKLGLNGKKAVLIAGYFKPAAGKKQEVIKVLHRV